MIARPSPHRTDRGAAVVEFALVVPMLLLLVVGIAEFSRVFHAQAAVSAAAREGARTMAVENDVDAAHADTMAAAPSLTLDASHIEVTPAECGPGQTAEVTVTYPFSFVTDVFGQGVTLTGHGATRCGG